MAFSVLCQHRVVSGGLTRQNKENLFFFLNISPIFFNISVSRNDQMSPLPTECQIYKLLTYRNRICLKISRKFHRTYCAKLKEILGN